jgi:predicted transcriptional regulator
VTPAQEELSARERQIMDVVWRLGEATAAQVRDEVPDAPSYSAVRALMRILEEKGHLKHRLEGRRYVYLPTAPKSRAQRSALQRMVRTFFGDSPERAVAALLDLEAGELSADELDRLAELVEQARRRGR